MDCDRVFMELTRGPFPSGAPTDALVEQHLEGCTDCWRFAEALRPIDDRLEEDGPYHVSDLPGYWGESSATRQAYHQVRTLALGSIATRRAPASPVPRELVDLRLHIGWADIARVGVFGVALVTTAMVFAWLWQPN